MICPKCNSSIIKGYCTKCDIMLALCKCDKCGSEVKPEKIDWSPTYSIEHILKAVAVGAIFGFVMCLLANLTC